jgi:FkbM family methyltransferase
MKTSALMNRPWLLRWAPARIRQSIAARIYLGQYHKWQSLYRQQPLSYCPQVSMHDLVPGDQISGHIVFNGFHELALTREIVRLAHRGGLLVDVGANMGYFSLLWAGSNPRARVIAFEPAPQNVRAFRNNIVRNGLTKQVNVVQKAAGRNSGTVHFDRGPASQTGWGGITSECSRSTIEVPLIRIDRHLANTSIDVLKIDVEGADTWVLFGCEGLLRTKSISRIFFEENPERMAKLGIRPGEAKDYLADLGYACEPLCGTAGEWLAYPRKP